MAYIIVKCHKKNQKQKQIPIDETKMVLEDSKRQKAATSEKFCIL